MTGVQTCALPISRVAGRFRKLDKQLTYPIAVGDVVHLEIDEDSDEVTGAIRKIEPRTNYVVRQSQIGRASCRERV